MSKSNVGNNEEGGDSAECMGGRIKILNQKERRKWMTAETGGDTIHNAS